MSRSSPPGACGHLRPVLLLTCRLELVMPARWPQLAVARVEASAQDSRSENTNRGFWIISQNPESQQPINGLQNPHFNFPNSFKLLQKYIYIKLRSGDTENRIFRQLSPTMRLRRPAEDGLFLILVGSHGPYVLASVVKSTFLH